MQGLLAIVSNAFNTSNSPSSGYQPLTFGRKASSGMPVRFGEAQTAHPNLSVNSTYGLPSNGLTADAFIPSVSSLGLGNPGVSNPAAPAAGPSVFDQFLLSQSEPVLSQPSSFSNSLVQFSNPELVKHLQEVDAANIAAHQVAGESPAERIMMYRTLNGMLKGKQKEAFQQLRDRGVLDDFRTEDGHSTLYHLYAMATTPRQSGYKPQELLKETVEMLEKPYAITQKFTPLSDSAEKQINGLRQHPALDPQAGRVDTQSQRPIQKDELKVDSSATCVASSVMYYMAQKEPGELARHLNELTSPMNAFYEKTRLSEISPDDPGKAHDILKQYGIPYQMNDQDEITLKVTLPTAGIIRAVNDQKAGKGHKTRTAIESAYQSALMHLATPTYDPATDLRAEQSDPTQTSKGLTEEEKSFMETIVKDNGAIQSVNYQVFDGKQKPAQGEEGTPFLYGYKRSFEQTANDMIRVLQKNHFIIVGTTETNKDGSLAGGHEVTLTQAFVDQKTGELKFVVADSDDDVPKLVVRSAREIIPKIHHAGMPVEEARAIKKETDQVPGILMPDDSDAKAFSLIDVYNPYKGQKPQGQQGNQPLQQKSA